MRWQEFTLAAPRLADLARECFDEQHLSIVGTLRASGWPRVSPCEIYFVDGELLLGMMPNSRKALDLLRDPRVTVVNGQSERIPKHGDVKLYGLAREVLDQQLRNRYADTLEQAIDWRPTDPFHLFAVDILSASYISFGKGQKVLRWTPERGLERLTHPDESDAAY